jgi:hypothetical protein
MSRNLKDQVASATCINDALQLVLGTQQPAVKLIVKGSNGFAALWISDGRNIVAATTATNKTAIRALPYIFALKEPKFEIEFDQLAPLDQLLKLEISRLLSKQDEVLRAINHAVAVVEFVAPHAGSDTPAHQAANANEEAERLGLTTPEQVEAFSFSQRGERIARLRRSQEFQIDSDPDAEEEEQEVGPKKKVTWQTEHIRVIPKLAKRIPLEIVAAVIISLTYAVCGYAFHGTEQERNRCEDQTSVTALADEAVDAESLVQEPAEPYRTAAPVVRAAPETRWASARESENCDEALEAKLDKSKKGKPRSKKSVDSPIRYTTVQLKEIDEKMHVADQLSSSGKFNEAAALYASAVSQFPRHAQLRVNAIRAYMRIRQKDAARALCTDGIKTADNDTDRFLFENLLSNLA